MNLINYWYQKYLQEKKENKELLSQLLKLTKELAGCTKENKQELDLEKEISDFLASYHLHIKDGGRVVFDNGDSPNLMCDIRHIAWHFFKLGRNTHE